MIDAMNNSVKCIKDDVNQVHGVLLIFLSKSAYNVTYLKIEGPVGI